MDSYSIYDIYKMYERKERAEGKRNLSGTITEHIASIGWGLLAFVLVFFWGICILAVIAIPLALLLDDFLGIISPGNRFFEPAQICTILVLTALSTGVFGTVAATLTGLCLERDAHNRMTPDMFLWMYRLVLSLLPLLLLSTINDSIIASFFAGRINLAFDINLTVMVIALILGILAVFLRYAYIEAKKVYVEEYEELDEIEWIAEEEYSETEVDETEEECPETEVGADSEAEAEETVAAVS